MFSFCPFLRLKVQAVQLSWCLITFTLHGCEWLVSYSSYLTSKCRNLSMMKVAQKAMSHFFLSKYSWIMKIIHNKKWHVSTMPCLVHAHKFWTNWCKSKGARLGLLGGLGNTVQPNLVMAESSHVCTFALSNWSENSDRFLWGRIHFKCWVLSMFWCRGWSWSSPLSAPHPQELLLQPQKTVIMILPADGNFQLHPPTKQLSMGPFNGRPFCLWSK